MFQKKMGLPYKNGGEWLSDENQCKDHDLGPSTWCKGKPNDSEKY